MPNPNAASINLVMNGFVENSAGVPASGAPGGSHITPASLMIANDQRGNPLNANGQVSISGQTITVARARNGNSAVPITINISCADGVNYNPQNIVFVQSNLSGDGDGNTNFTDRQPSNQSITINNQCRHRGRKNGPGGNQAPAWQFYVQVKQAGTGKLGWIDPVVENTEQD